MEIEGEKGTFYGPVNIKSNLPQGYGVFYTDLWVHCSSVTNGTFAAGKRVSVNRQTKEMKLVYTKFQSDGTKLQKIESFTAFYHTSCFCKNGVKVDNIIERFDLNSESQDWLSLKPQKVPNLEF